jgi:D-xylose transport system permease protein
MTAVRTAPEAAPLDATTSLSTHVNDYWLRVKGGELGSLPAVLALVVLCTIFAIVRPVFMSAGNFANLLPQAAAVTLIAMGLIFVLLIGEIDLSAGFTSGVCAAVMTMLLAEFDVPWYVGLLGGILTGTVIGVLLGTTVAKIGIPSFVVTLAAFLGFQGVLLILIKEGQIIRISDPVILAISNKNMPVWLGWALYALAIGLYALVQFGRLQGRKRRGLTHDPLSLVLLRVGSLAIAAGFAVYALSVERSRNVLVTSTKGVPYVVPIIVVLLVVLTFVLKRTGYGLHIYAVGGNREAALRAGINVDRIRISAFMVCSTMAAVGGIVAASRDQSVNPNTGGSNVLLYAVGAAVIGGTSLFGGKGRIIDAVLGGLVVAVIVNGMTLLDLKSGVKYILTGSVLLVAAGVDALSRRRAASTGLR